MEWNQGSVIRRKFKQGEIICNEGESGSTAFIIEEGVVDVFLKSPLNHIKNTQSSGFLGLIKKFMRK